MTITHFALDPPVRLTDHMITGASWEELDHVGSRAIGADCIAVPSVRVALSWTLGHLGLSRHRDHVLVPRYTSRCILANLSRRALPTEEPTARTRALVVVHQYGLRQELQTIADECTARGWTYLEDAAYGPDEREGLGPGCRARFIGLTKTLPVLRGALVLTDDTELAGALRRARERTRAWTFVVLLALSYVRAGSRTSGSSHLAEIAYEMYEPAGGADSWTRGNMRRGLDQLDRFSTESGERRAVAQSSLGARLIAADAARTPYVGAYRAPDLGRASAIATAHGFASDIYHIDVARNVLRPAFEKAILIPFNPRIPRDRFDAFVEALAVEAD